MRIIHREDQEEQAHEALSPDASFADESEGSARSTEPDILRNDYQRDRDKILHTKSFRRLSHKTQVFLAAEGDHFRTRLDPHARGGADRPDDRPGARPERGSYRGDRARARSRPHAVRPYRRGGACELHRPASRHPAQRCRQSAALPPQRSRACAWSRCIENGGKGLEPHARGARRHHLTTRASCAPKRSRGASWPPPTASRT